jgi:hypothetical protein
MFGARQPGLHRQQFVVKPLGLGIFAFTNIENRQVMQGPPRLHMLVTRNPPSYLHHLAQEWFRLCILTLVR